MAGRVIHDKDLIAVWDATNSKAVALAGDSNGHPQIDIVATVQMSETDPFYTDEDTINRIIAFMYKSGNYYFMKETPSAGANTARYWKPTTLSYAADWADRTNKTYALPTVL